MMNRNLVFCMTADFHRELYENLFPGDGKESVALGLCGISNSVDRKRLTLHKIVFIPNESCRVRTQSQVTWSTEILQELLMEAAKKKLSIVKIHSHPTGYERFSRLDDLSDDSLYNIKDAWLDKGSLCVSLVMLPDSSIFGRVIRGEKNYQVIDSIQTVGDDIRFLSQHRLRPFLTAADRKNSQTLGEGTITQLRNLRVGVIGCSGTGSVVIEQLMRLSVGKLVLVDPDRLETKNLNRILNSTKDDAAKGNPKVEVLADFINKVDSEIEVATYSQNVFESELALKDLSVCDALFGCVDTVDGRHLINLLSTYYCIPFFDLGVKITADGLGGIEKICGTVHYVRPGASSLLTRGVYTIDDLNSAALYRANPEEYENLVQEKYIKNVNVERPAVISVNMAVASAAVNEFLCRIHQIRSEAMSNYAVLRICISDGYVQYESEAEQVQDLNLQQCVGLGDRVPFLNLPELSPLTHESLKVA
jgi:hypothetical protein